VSKIILHVSYACRLLTVMCLYDAKTFDMEKIKCI